MGPTVGDIAVELPAGNGTLLEFPADENDAPGVDKGVAVVVMGLEGLDEGSVEGVDDALKPVRLKGGVAVLLTDSMPGHRETDVCQLLLSDNEAVELTGLCGKVHVLKICWGWNSEVCNNTRCFKAEFGGSISTHKQSVLPIKNLATELPSPSNTTIAAKWLHYLRLDARIG